MAGYWQRPDETAKVMTADGYFKTGDIGVVDERGFFRPVTKKPGMRRNLRNIFHRMTLTEQDVRITGADGKANSVHRKAGEAVWETPSVYKQENLVDKPLEMIVAQLKD